MTAKDAVMLPAHVWRAQSLGHTPEPGLPSGFASLDAELPGNGWPLGTLTELIAREPGVGELRLLMPCLRQISREGSEVGEHVIHLAHRLLHALFHAHAEQLVEFLHGVEVGGGRHSRPGRCVTEGEDHPHRRH